MAFTKIVSPGIDTTGSYTVQELNTVGVMTAGTVQVGSATTVHTTGIDLGSGNITSHNINSTGIITATSFVGPVSATNGTFSGNVSIGGTLTYEDVTNIDSVGIITARQGIDTDTVRGKTNNSNLAIGARASNGAFVQTITIKPDRSVGLGNITNPTSILDVRQTNTGGATEIKLFNLDQSNATTQTAALVMTPDVRANGVKIVAVKEVADMSSSANKDLALTFQSVANNAAVERLRIKSDGNVKFATNNSTTDYFEWGGNPRLFLQAPSGLNGLRIYGDTTPLEIGGSASTRKISMGGNPNYDLSISGSYSLSSGQHDSSPKVFLNATRHNGSGTVTSFQTSIQAVSVSNTSNDGYLGLGASATPDDLVIRPSGNIGINETAPYYKLHLKTNNNATSLSGGSNGNWGSDGIRIENTNTTVGSMSLAHFRNYDADWHIGGKYNSANNSDFVFLAEGNERLRITNTGTLDFRSTDGTGINFLESGYINIDSDNNDSNRNFSFYDAKGTGNEKRLMILTDTGDMGLGTATPTSFGPTLQVAGTDPALLLQDTATAVDFYGMNVQSGAVINWFDDSAYFAIGTAAGLSGSAYSEKLRIKSGGEITSGNISINAFANDNTPSGYSQFQSDNHANTIFGQNLKLGASAGSGNHQIEIINQHSTIGGAGMYIGGNGSNQENAINFYAESANQSAGTDVTANRRAQIASSAFFTWVEPRNLSSNGMSYLRTFGFTFNLQDGETETLFYNPDGYRRIYYELFVQSAHGSNGYGYILANISRYGMQVHESDWHVSYTSYAHSSSVGGNVNHNGIKFTRSGYSNTNITYYVIVKCWSPAGGNPYSNSGLTDPTYRYFTSGY